MTGLFAARQTESGRDVGPVLSVGPQDDPEGVDDAGEEAEQGEQDVDEQLAGDPVHHEDGNRWEEEAKEKSQNSVSFTQ